MARMMSSKADDEMSFVPDFSHPSAVSLYDDEDQLFAFGATRTREGGRKEEKEVLSVK